MAMTTGPAGRRVGPGQSLSTGTPAPRPSPCIIRAVMGNGDEEELDGMYGSPEEAIAAALTLSAARRPGRLARLFGAAEPLPAGTRRVIVCYPSETGYRRHGYAILFDIGVRCDGRAVTS